MGAFVLLALVALQRLADLVVARRNTKRLMQAGATEIGAAHYPLIVSVHAAWLLALVAWAVFVPQHLSMLWLLVYIALQVLRLWVMLTLGRFWTTRIIVPREMPLICRGPYRFLRHPNYVVVALEIAALPLVIGAWPLAIIFSLLNAAILKVRITAENRSFELRVPMA
jgi:methyltransferase